MKLTVGIATWNRADLLRQTLEGLTQVRIPPGVEWEILVCDNNSTDATRATVEAEIARGRLPLRYLFAPTQGKSFALNQIVSQAQGQWILFTDDDVIVDPDWVAQYVQAIARHPETGVLSGAVRALPVRPVSRSEQYLLDTFPWINALLEVPVDRPMADCPGQMGNGNNLAARTDVARRLGFDTQRCMTGGSRGGEDTVFLRSALQSGQSGWMVAGPVVGHIIPTARLGWRWLCRWHMGLGREMYYTQGPAPAGAGDLRLWHYKLIARLLCLALWRRLRGHKRQAYETLGDASAQWGYLRFGRRNSAQPSRKNHRQSSAATRSAP